MHLMLLRFSSLGDVVIQTSFASWIKSNFPKCHITFVTSNEFVSLVKNHPHIDEVVPYIRSKGLQDLKNLRLLTRQLNSTRPIDFILDLHGTTRSFFLKFLNPDIPCLNLDKRRIERFLLTKIKWDLLRNQKTLHERTIDDYQSFFNIKYDRTLLEGFISKLNQSNGSITSAPESFVHPEFNKPFEKYIVIAPVASFTSKRWPMKSFIELAKQLLEDSQFKEYAITLVAGPTDEYADDFNSVVELFPNRAINLKGKTTLAESSSVIRHSELLIGNDTGMGHIAESFGVPIISIFGPTSESFGFKPHMKSSQSLSTDLWCRPCSTTGKKKCFRSKQFCMENVTIDSVYKTIKTKLFH